MRKKETLVDVAIIGGGPAGLFTAFNCGMRGLSTKVLEASKDPGGKVARFYPEKYIYDVGGIPGISGEELVKNMVAQAAMHHQEIITGSLVEQVEKNPEGIFCLTTDKGDRHYSRTVIACSGMGRYDPVLLEIEGLNQFEGEFLHYMFNKPEKFTGKKVAILSSHRAGIDWAAALEGKADRVYLINESNKFAAAGEEDLDKLNELSAHLHCGNRITSFYEEKGQLKQITLTDEEGGMEEVEVDQLLVYQGIKFIPAPFKEWNIVSERSRIVVSDGMESNLEGFYAAGDAAYYPGKSLLIANGYTEAITAVNSAALYLDSNAPKQMYSTVVYRHLH